MNVEPLESRIAPATVFGLDTSNNLLRFDSSTPGTIVSSILVTGIKSGETLLGIDFRPVDGQLYGLGSTSRLYLIDQLTGVATEVGLFEVSLNGTAFGFDFNPTVDRIRVVSDVDENFRLNPGTGGVVDFDPGTPGIQPDVNLVYDNTTADGDPIDPNAGANPFVVGAAYTNNVAGAATTTLHGIDTALDILVIQSPPNNGVLNTVGSLGVDATSVLGFDIETTSTTGLAAMVVGGVPRLYSINLATGAASLIGAIGGGATLRGLAIAPPGFTASFGGGVATFTGSAANDEVVFDASGGLLRHNRFSLGNAGFSSDFDFDTAIPGDQTISATNPSVLVIINGGIGDDRVTLGSATAPKITFVTEFVVNGEGGFDSLTIDDAADGFARTVTLTPGKVAGITGVVTAGTDEVIVRSGGGRDVFNIDGTSTPTSILAGGGDDRFIFGTGATLSGGVLDGGAGFDSLDYVDAGGAVDLAETNAVFFAKLSGRQEPGPLSGSPVSGFGVFTLNAEETALAFDIRIADLMGATVTGNHFHNGTVGVNGAIVRGLIPAEEIDIIPPDERLAGTWTSTDAEPLTPALVAELEAGRIYFNTHTNLFPSGEARGQLEPQGLFGSATGTSGIRAIEQALDFGTIDIVNATTATFTDLDGDVVMLKVRNGDLAMATFRTALAGSGTQVLLLDMSLAVAGQTFNGASVTLTAKRGPLGGDGFVNIGQINATGIDLGAVKIAGDLGQLDAGDGDPGAPAVKSLNAVSLGVLGRSTQDPVTASLESNINGQLGPVKIATNVKDAHLNVEGGISKLTIGGSLIGGSTLFSGRIATTGDVGPVKIGGDLRGGDGEQSAHLFIGGKLTSATVGGSLVGEGAVSARIRSGLDMGPVKIAGDIRGGAGHDSGQVLSFTKIASVTVGGSLIGGAADAAGSIISFGDLGALAIKGDVVGSSATRTGYIEVTGVLARLAIGGSIFGGSAGTSGLLISNAQMGTVSIGGSVVGGAGSESGQISSSGSIKSVFIGGSLLGGAGQQSGFLIAGDGAGTGDIGTLTIRGSVIGGTAFTTGRIGVDGNIGKLSIGGSLLGGNVTDSGLVRAEAIGSVFIGRDIAGGDATGANFVAGTGVLVAQRIGKVTVGGSLLAGEDRSTDVLRVSGAIVAEDDLGRVTIKGSITGSIAPDGTITDALIVGRGQAVVAAGSAINFAIKSLTVGGSVERAQVLGGYVFDGLGMLVASNPDAQIGKVTVGGNWTASSIAAGVRIGADNVFGTSDDEKIPGTDAPQIISRIASILIKGFALGTGGGDDHFGFVAQQIGSFKIGSTRFPLTAGAGNDLAGMLVGATGDLRVAEIAQP
jgi:hypothetical protein